MSNSSLGLTKRAGTDAARGYFVAEAGSSEQTACAPGKFAEFRVATTCVNCTVSYLVWSRLTFVQVGSFAANGASEVCDLASPGHFVDTEGATVETDW